MLATVAPEGFISSPRGILSMRQQGRCAKYTTIGGASSGSVWLLLVIPSASHAFTVQCEGRTTLSENKVTSLGQSMSSGKGESKNVIKVEPPLRLSPHLLKSKSGEVPDLLYFNDSKIFSAAARGFSAA